MAAVKVNNVLYPLSIFRVFVKFLNSSAQIGNNRDQNNYLLKTCYTASCEVAGTQIEIAE